MNKVYLFKIEPEKPPNFLAAHGVKIDFTVGYFTQNTDFCVLLAMILVVFCIHFQLQDLGYFLPSLLPTKINSQLHLI